MTKNLSSRFWKSLAVPVTPVLFAVLALAGLQAAGAARADVWSYVDPQGMAHFSHRRVDEGYEIFLQGGDSFSAGSTFAQGALAATGGDGDGGGGGGDLASGLSQRKTGLRSPSSITLQTYFDILPNYKAVKHLLREASAAHGIDYELLQALIATESGFNARAVSPKGAVGLMQLIPPTAARYGVKAEKNAPIQVQLTDPKTNIQAGATYLRELLNRFPGEVELALAAYNAGEGAVQRAGNKIPNYPETRHYVKTVMQLYTRLRASAPTATAASATRRVRLELPAPVSAGFGAAAALPQD